MTQPIITGNIVANSGATLTARILGQLGQPITQASLSSIVYAVTDLTTGVVLGSNVAIPLAAVSNSPIGNDPRWTKDTAQNPGPDGRSGYNFLFVVPAVYFPLQHRYEVRVTFTPIVGQPWVQVWRMTAL